MEHTKRRLRLAPISFAVAMSLAAATAVPLDATSGSKRVAPAPVKKEVVLELGDPGKPIVVRPGQDTIPVRVSNRTKKTVRVWFCGFWPNHKWQVRDAAGHNVKPTAFGASQAKVFGTQNWDKRAPHDISPAGSYRYKTPPLLTDFDLKPGRYELVLTYRDDNQGKPLTLISRSTPFTVVKGAKPKAKP